MSDYWPEISGADLPLFSSVNTQCAIEKPVEPTDEMSGSEKRKIVLQRLIAGKLSTVEAETLVHRGQAIIGELRERGHVIHTIRGEYVYERGPDVELIKVSKSLQDAYYATPHWKTVSAERKQFDNFTCQQCRKQSDLETHHWRYELFEEDLLLDLITLCKSCHNEIHDAVSGSSVHFPSRLPESVIERIKKESGCGN